MWKPKSFFSRQRSTSAHRAPQTRRPPRGEQLEPRTMMAANPIHVGVTYLETDYLETGSDEVKDEFPDRFVLSFTGGAPGTELTELHISTDKDGDGLSVGDLIFDTKTGGRGTEGFHDFQVVRTESVNGGKITVTAEVLDGSTDLIIRLTGFKAGDLVEFSLDVDEILRLSPDLEFFNSRLDASASGQEFQDSILNAVFKAPHYEVAHADGLFVNDYGDPAASLGLRLPPDESSDPNSRPNRSAAAVGTTTQIPKPVSIAGTVWVDNNLNLRREANEATLANVQLSLWKKDASGRFVDTGFKQTTDANGRYVFGTSLGLMPGEYQVIETQPSGLFSVGAVVGKVGTQTVGRVASDNVLTGIQIPLGDTHAVEYDFAEARPAQVSGFVYRDDNDNGRKDTGETGLAGVKVRLVPISTIAPQNTIETTTGADGSYSFGTLPPGRYDIVEVTQPAGLTDGRESVGTVNGQVVGSADEPGDAIRNINLPGDGRGIQYNFGELPLGSIAGG
ncbi:MAG: SdrD B-like domain-containing protein, partial [Planctomycetaceae bacterium]